MEMVLLHTSYNNLTKELDQLQTSYNNLTKEQDRLQQRVENITMETNDLQKNLQDCDQLGWVYFNRSFYYISLLKKSWQDSRDDCLQRGADLVIINSKEEQNFTSQFKRLTWIGLTNKVKEVTWKWVDGTSPTTSFWAKGQPGGGKDRNCTKIISSNLDNNWNDELCNLQNFWICEKRLPV
ncbi:CD209 antigen-like [Micropterus dolomieu]|uniref:CD209 antigen-like n=1 Tax=Micropterus dolomieu TaxID=147949 RepID=UPI001E8D9D0C|nr:CD209 antigen-like [Micropterus dolomieu]